MRLGEAYVNIRADLKPYYRDLQAGLRETTKAFEKALNKELGRKFGKDISVGVRESMTEGARGVASDVSKQFEGLSVQNRRRTRKATGDGFREGLFDALQTAQGAFTFIASSLASALDDGISALPKEAKAAITATLLVVTPIIVAQLGSAIAAAISVGVAGLGIALASQLQPVQEAFAQGLTRGRNALVEAAGPLIGPLTQAIDNFVNLLERDVAPTLESIFTRIAPGIEALIEGVGTLVDEIFNGILAGSADIDDLLRELGVGFRTLGILIGESMRLLLSTGRDGRAALRDLVTVIGLTVLGVSALATALIEVYGTLRDITFVLRGDLAGLVAATAEDALEKQRRSVFQLSNEYGGLVVATDAETKALEEQTKAAEDNAKALDKVVDAANDLLTSQIDVERSRDELTEAIKEHGRSLDIDSEKGRVNIEKTQNLINKVRDSLLERVKAGELTAQAAERQFDLEVAALEKTFGATKKGRQEFERLFRAMIDSSKARLDASPWITAFGKIGAAARAAIDRIKELSRLSLSSGVAPPPSGTSRAGGQHFADGGRITRPTFATLGEGYRPEVVLPETKPARAAEILAGSTLAGILGGPTTVVAIFDGEPFQARIVNTVRGAQNRAARNISQVPRSI